jgi:hypothetical protein
MRHPYLLQLGAACVACGVGLALVPMAVAGLPAVIVMWFATLAWCVGTVRGPLGAAAVSALLFGCEGVAFGFLFWLLFRGDSPDLTAADVRMIAAMLTAGWIISGVVASVLTKWVAVVPLRRLRRRLFPPEGICACGYPTRGLPGPRCPECGRELRRREQ